MKLVITIDVEEDQWGEYKTNGYSLENIKELQGLQKIFDGFNAKPTYLINYPVATDEFSIEMFRTFLADEKCEIGAHCHPWNTPPFEEKLGFFNSMFSNLSEELQYRKLEILKKTIEKKFEINLVSFRAGRWALSNTIAQAIYKLGFKIDTSVMPYTQWADIGGVDYSNCTPLPYRFSSDDIFMPSKNGELLEVPVSIGFLQKQFATCGWLSRLADKKMMKAIHLRGILSRLKILDRISLSPELSTSSQMIDLTKRMDSLGYKIINLFFHSTTLLSGCSPFNKNKEDRRLFFENLNRFLEYTVDNGIECILLKETLKINTEEL